jgi:hypothetical protein
MRRTGFRRANLKVGMLKQTQRMRRYRDAQSTCEVCGGRPVDCHHVRARRVLGEAGDTEANFVSLCRKHHGEAHQVGVEQFWRRYPWLGKFRDAAIARGLITVDAQAREAV